ncbi:MAG: hypothetical protein LBG70_04375, partial [Bifidobacteriaceae bacterium]|nr:hypothetical protein [Bifidobacteriaceae bacterium]
MKGVVPRLLGDSTARSRVWQWAIASAAFLTTLVLAMLVVTHASYIGRTARDAARAPIFTEIGDPAQIAWFHWRTEESGLQPVDVMAFEVTDPQAAPPPGIDRWPKPGEVFVSPALAATAFGDGFVARYGHLAGTIARQAL